MTSVADELRGARVMVVGGAGFVGSNLAHRLLECDIASLVLVDNLLSSDIANVPRDPRSKFVFGSVAEDRVLANLPGDVNYVFHLACYHGNQSSIADPLADHANNTLTSLKLFDWLKGRTTLRKVVYASAGCAVAEKTFDTAHATSEEQPVSLYHDSPYSISKLIGELYGNFYFQRYGLPFVKARFQNVYGPREILGAGRWRGTPHTVWRNVTPTFIWKSLAHEPLPLDNGGIASRDFIFVGDIVGGLIRCALAGRAGEVYNLASGVETTILELARVIDRVTGNPTPPEIRPARDWDRSGKRFGSTEKSRRELGFNATVAVERGIELTVDWTRVHADLIRRCMTQHEYMLAHP